MEQHDRRGNGPLEDKKREFRFGSARSDEKETTMVFSGDIPDIDETQRPAVEAF